MFHPGSAIGFNQKRHFVNEPTDKDEVRYVRLVLVRNGDTSRTSIVRLYTKDGSAKADKDFAPLSKVSNFVKFIASRVCQVVPITDNDNIFNPLLDSKLKKRLFKHLRTTSPRIVSCHDYLNNFLVCMANMHFSWLVVSWQDQLLNQVLQFLGRN